jgi:hypothetical protein
MVPWKLVIIALTYTQPFLIGTTVAIAATPKEQPYDNYSYGLIGAYFLVFSLLAVRIPTCFSGYTN